MSTFSCPVVRVGKIGKNPNADNLSIWGGYMGPVQFSEGQFKEGDLACFVPVDSLVDTSLPEFDFLKPKADFRGVYRVRGIKLRKLPSVGLLVPLDRMKGLLPNDPLGDVGFNCADLFGIKKYEPPQTHSFGTDSMGISVPAGCEGLPVYDIENLWHMERPFNFKTEEDLTDKRMMWSITEKIHGCNARFTVVDGKVVCGSRSRWVMNDGNNVWSTIGKRYEKDLLSIGDKYIVYGEVYGKVQDLKYGLNDGVAFLVFDLFDKETRMFVDVNRMTNVVYDTEELYTVPMITGNHLVDAMTFTEAIEYAKSKASGQSLVASAPQGHIREGVVLRPMEELTVRTNGGIGRLITKVISPEYSSRLNGTEEH